MFRKILMGVGVLVVICIGFFAVTFGLAMMATNGVASAADSFMTELKNQDYDAAYAMFTPELQEQISSDTFESMFANVFGDGTLESWTFSSRSVENNIGEVSGSATIDGEAFAVSLSFVHVDGWKLTAFDFSPQ